MQMVEYLMNLASDPTVKDKFDNTPFNDAVRSKHDEVVSVIKKFDPEISFKLAVNELWGNDVPDRVFRKGRRNEAPRHQ